MSVLDKYHCKYCCTEEGHRCPEANGRIRALEAALREAMEWNWLDEENPPPYEVERMCNEALTPADRGADHG